MQIPPPPAEQDPWGITRRDMIRLSALGVGGLILVACDVSGTQTTTGATTSATASTVAPTTTVPVPSVLRVNMNHDINTLDPGLMTALVETTISWGVFSGLVRFGHTMEFLPDMATEWNNSDPLTWEFHLRDGVTFHSGRPITAADVVWSMERYRDLGAEGRVAALLADVESFHADSDSVVRFAMATPSSVLPYNLAYAVLLDSETIDDIATQPIGSGPLTFHEWIPNERYVLHRYEDYWDTSIPRADEYVFIPATEPETRVANIRAGEVHAADFIPPQLVPELEQIDEIQVVQPPITVTYMTAVMNTQQTPFDDVRVRRALAHAIDRDELVTNAYFGVGDATGNFFPAGHWVHRPGSEPPEFSLEQAAELLTEAGYLDGVDIEIKYHEADSRVAQVLQSQLGRAGFNVTLTLMDVSVWVDEALVGRDFQLIPAEFAREVDPDGLISSVFQTGGGNNFAGYTNDEVDALFQEGKAVADETERAEIYNRLQAILFEDVPTVKLATTTRTWAMASNVRNAHVLPKGNPYFPDLSLA